MSANLNETLVNTIKLVLLTTRNINNNSNRDITEL